MAARPQQKLSDEAALRTVDSIMFSRIRLAILATLSPTGSSTFTQLRDAIQLTDGSLGGHIRRLELGGYVDVEKSFVNRRPLTRIVLTAFGRQRLDEYCNVMGTVIDHIRLRWHANEPRTSAKQR